MTTTNTATKNRPTAQHGDIVIRRDGNALDIYRVTSSGSMVNLARSSTMLRQRGFTHFGKGSTVSAPDFTPARLSKAGGLEIVRAYLPEASLAGAVYYTEGGWHGALRAVI